MLGVMLASGVAAAEGRAAGPELVRSAGSGPWSAPRTWEGGKVPGAGARVQVRAGHTVTYDVKSDAVIRSVHVAGTLTFACDRDTRLAVGLLKIQAGDDAGENGFDCDAHLAPPEPGRPQPALEVGTPGRPIPAGHTALIRLTYVPGMDRETCPAIVCCGGRMDLHGAPLGRTWVKLGATVEPGDAIVRLAEPAAGWRVGDHVIVTTTSSRERINSRVTLRPGAAGGRAKFAAFTEERTVKAIAGDRLTLDRPLEHRHRGAGDYRGEVANLSRNVVIESAEPAGVR